MKKTVLQAALAAANLSLANDSRDILTDTGRGYQKGQFYAANDSRFNATYYIEPLTTYALGWRDPNNIEATLQFLAPEVVVPRRFDWKKGVNAEEFLSELTDDQRAIGSDFKNVEYTQTDITSKTINKGLGYVMDLDAVVGTGWEQRIVAKLMRRLLRNEVRRAVAGLSAAATNTAKTWSSGTPDADQDVRDELITAANLTGIRPNRVLYGDTAYNSRVKGYRIQNNAGAYASADLTPDEVAAAISVDRVLVSRERYQNAAATKAEIVANKAIMFYAQDDADTEDASQIKRFVSMHDADAGGGRYQVYRQQLSSKLVMLSVGYYSSITVTYPTGIRQFTVS